MDPAMFESIAVRAFENIPERYKARVKNVALLIEDEPSEELRAAEGLSSGETLLGLYHGIPASERGDFYSGVLPDTITLFRLPILEEARRLRDSGRAHTEEASVRLAVEETLWHEIGHYFGLSEEAVHARESASTNHFRGSATYAQGEGQTHPREYRKGILFRALRPPGRLTSLMLSMAKTLAIIFGVIFVLLGLLGFISNPLVGTGALFEANTAHNLLHLILGIILLVVAFWMPVQSSLWLKIIGVVYLLVALLGFFSGSPLLGIFTNNSADNWLHIIFGIVLIAIGMYAKDAVSTAAMPPANPPAGGMGTPSGPQM